jgi:SAM-dependent methyltransferase
MDESNVNLWQSPEHALDYLGRADTIPHRVEGERALLESLPVTISRVLDLGSGDGRLLRLVRLARPGVQSIAIDFSPAMLERLEQNFRQDSSVSVVAHDLNDPLPDALGTFDAIVSSFAIHHVPHARKRALYEEVFAHLAPGGVFLNLEHVASPTPALHRQFLDALSVDPADEDPSNNLLDMQTQLEWLLAIGFDDVDCHWKWRELALLAGVAPTGSRG